MKQTWKNPIFVIGIIFILIGIILTYINLKSGYITLNAKNPVSGSRGSVMGGALYLLLGLGMVFYSIVHVKSSKNKEKLFNFRDTNSSDNCLKCKYWDSQSFDGFEANCNYFHIKTDENHVCDKLKPQLEKNVKKSNQLE